MPAIIAGEMFVESDFEAPLSGVTSVATYMLSSIYAKAATEANNSGYSVKASVYAFLGSVMGIHMRATDKAAPWGPQLEMADGRRTIIPTDAKAQLEQLQPLLPHMNNPILKSRIADLVWSNDMRQTNAAIIAVESYAEIVTKILNRSLHGYDDQKADHFEALRFLQRGMSIASAISGKNALPESIVSALKILYDSTKNSMAYVACADTAELGCRNRILDQRTVARELEAMVCAASPEIVPEAVRKASDYAAYLFGKLKDEDGKERCQLRSVSLLLAMADHCSQAGAKASWVMDALQALGRMKGHDEQKAALKKTLRELQAESSHEFATFSVPLNIEDEREAMHQRFLGYDLSDALKNFALLSQSPSKEKLRQEAVDSMSSSPLLATMTMAHLDGDGKVIAKTEGARPGDAPSEEWFDTTISRSEGLRRQIVMGAGIDPARQAITLKFSIIEEHLEPVVSASWFVPQSQKPILGLGFARLIQGDFISAAHLIIPQLEPCLRNALQLNGIDTGKRRNNSTEEDQDLSALFRNHRTELERILGADLTYELELLFDRTTGNRLRHLIAHGNMGAGGCYSPDVIYACWLLYRVSCLPVLIAGWDKIVRPCL